MCDPYGKKFLLMFIHSYVHQTILHTSSGGGELRRGLSCFQYSVASILGKRQCGLGSTALPDLCFIMLCKEPPLLARLVRI